MKEYIKLIYKEEKESYFKLIEEDLKKEQKRFIVTVNPETLMLSKKDQEIKEILLDKKTSLTPDGIAVVKAANKIGIPIKERITGIDIAEYLLASANRNKYSLYLFGAKEEVINSLKKIIEKEYPNIKLLGATNGYVKNKEEIMSHIIALKPDIVLLAMGIPLQEKLIYKHIEKAKKGIYMGGGGIFDVLSKTKKRAPKLFIKLNLEWLYRIITEPKRLKRFFNNNIKFILQIKK